MKSKKTVRWGHVHELFCMAFFYSSPGGSSLSSKYIENKYSVEASAKIIRKLYMNKLQFHNSFSSWCMRGPGIFGMSLIAQKPSIKLKPTIRNKKLYIHDIHFWSWAKA
jgi:hypothetical protein